ncbi:MAG: hypothetical protein KC462_05430 [Cyanobacteria bacterium HKST-UBA05]|nr:hypothetical protein [Cyanobacteria bacterium HKST-UBA05]
MSPTPLPESMLPLLVDYIVAWVLICTILFLGAQRLKAKIQFYAMQSLGLSVLLGAIGLAHQNTKALILAVVAAIGKCIIIPLILRYVKRRVPMNKGVESYVAIPTTMLMGGGMIMAAHYLTNHLFYNQSHLFNEMLSTGMALVFIGMLVMMVRKKAFTQILGLYVVDNGIFCLTMATVFEMPMIIEMGILFELLLGVLVMGILVQRIHDSFQAVTLDELEQLKG